MGGYIIPKNLRNEKDAYIFSFANRTKKNLQFIKEIAEIEKKRGRKAEDALVYEVTQLINSMIGLVTFPKEAFFKKALEKAHGYDASAYLKDLIISIERKPVEFDYKNTYLFYTGKKVLDGRKWSTYSKDVSEELSVLNFIRHFRNALSHEKLSVYPYSINTDEEIKGFVFEDEKKIKVVDIGDRYIQKDCSESIELTQEFRIKLTVEQIEAVAMDICDILLAVARDTYKIKEDVDAFY